MLVLTHTPTFSRLPFLVWGLSPFVWVSAYRDARSRVDCFFCERQEHPGELCPVSPRLGADYNDHLWMEMAGMPCDAWSNIGPGARWLHESTLPSLVWAYSTNYYEPDSVTLECTKGLDGLPIEYVFASHEQRTVSPSAPPLPQGEGLAMSCVHVMCRMGDSESRRGHEGQVNHFGFLSFETCRVWQLVHCHKKQFVCWQLFCLASLALGHEGLNTRNMISHRANT